MNSGTMKSFRPAPKTSAAPLESVILPPAAATTAWPAATSHSRGRRQPGIDIDAAFGDPAEFDRRAEFAPYRARPCRNEGFGPGIAMRAADRDRPRLAARRAGAGANRLDQRFALAKRQPFRAAADDAAPDQPERGRADDAEQRRSVGHQRQIDGEFVAAGDEFLGAVERVDQEEAFLIGQRGLHGRALPTATVCRAPPAQGPRR